MTKHKRFTAGIMAFIMALTIMTSAVMAAPYYDCPEEPPLVSFNTGDGPPAYPWD